MSRVTPPVQKFTFQAVRRISSTPNAARPSVLLSSSRNAHLPRSECTTNQLNANGSTAELVDRSASHDLISSHGYHTAHRPQLPRKMIPLMQGFQTSAPKQRSGDASTIESFIFPAVSMEAPDNSFENIRVPLLPDNFYPNRSADSIHAAEALDTAAPRSEISVIAAHPDTVLATAMSEVVGNDGVDIDINQLTTGFSDLMPDIKEPSALKELWTGIVDDILGAAKQNPKLAI